MANTEYHKVGTTLRTPFLVLDNGAPERGLASWTIQLEKNGTGNIATTGVTVSEVDASNNPGMYQMEVNATTGFVAATGSYGWRLSNTAASGNPIEVEGGIVVTANGLGSGTIGAASFTATAGDGRVTDGTSALEDATVTIYDSSDKIVTQLVTDSSGLWGPVFLDTGSYSVYSQKAGYNQASGTITVSGGVATGPGADLQSTIATNSTTITAGELISYIKRQAHNHTGTMTDAIAYDILNDAMNMVSKAHEWSFLHRAGIVSLVGAYSTGTVEVTNGSATVTLTGGTFPSWVASGEIRINNVPYAISTRDSNTQVTLDHTYGDDSASGLAYVVYQDTYSLPTDTIGVRDFYWGNGWEWGSTPVPFDHIVEQKSMYPLSSSRSYYHAIADGKVVLYPYPSDNRDIVISYQKRMGKFSSASDVVDFDVIHLDLLHCAIDHHICRYYGQTSGFQNIESTFAEYHRHLGLAQSSDKSILKRPSPTGSGRVGRLNSRYMRLS